MKQDLKKQQENDPCLDILNFLNKNTNDCFFIWEIQSGYLYFSGDIQKYAISSRNLPYYTLKDWIDIVYDKDLPDFLEEIEQIKKGKQFVHNSEYRIKDYKGEFIWIHCQGKCQLGENGEPIKMVGRISSTVLEHKVDPLTGVLGMGKLMQDIEKNLEEYSQGYLLIFGIDNLKSINMKYGREYGNKILKTVANSIQEAVEEDKLVYRTGGDCFAVNLIGTDEKSVEKVYKKIQKDLTSYCTSSAGAVPYQRYLAPNAGTLYQYAESALDRAKILGKNMLVFFSAEDFEKKLSAIELQEELQQSVENDFKGFSLCYQAQITSQNYHLFGAEALLRYHSEHRGNVSPIEFIPILEQTGLICPVGCWVLKNALEQCKKWREQIPDFHISVNISYVQLEKDGCAKRVLDILEKSGLPGSVLTLEVTESVQLQDYPHLNEVFAQWKNAGIEISVDDFGTGYSSLSSLKNLEVDEIKIDRCFVRGIQHSAYNYRLMSNILEWANSSQIRVCCEGVETVEELTELEKLNPNLMQGYLFSKPYRVEQFEEVYLDKNNHAFQARKEWEKSFSKLETSCKSPDKKLTEEDKITAIMQAMDEIVYVSDPKTYEVYYLNPKAQELVGIHDYRGYRCYKLLQGREEPCPFCTNSLLSRERFYTWERQNDYWGRRFILKDKLIPWGEKTARLEIAIDVTEQQNFNQKIEDKLDFAENIVTGSKILAEDIEMDQAIQRVLASIGAFYQADRSYLFQFTDEKGGTWNNIYEWQKTGVCPQQEMFQEIPAQSFENWIELFQNGESIVVSNLDSLRNSSPIVWKTLAKKGISRMIAVPVWSGNHELFGFLGVDNPRHRIQDDSQIRVLSFYLTNRLKQDKNEKMLKELLHFRQKDSLDSVNLGLWIIHIDKNTNQRKMYIDDIACYIMGFEQKQNAEKNYRYWYNRIAEDYRANLQFFEKNALEEILQNQIQYVWNHPIQGNIMIHSQGYRIEDTGETICLEGCFWVTCNRCWAQLIPKMGVLDYNWSKKTICFLMGSDFLGRKAKDEQNFPQNWIDDNMVHPHFIESFKDFLSCPQKRKETNRIELLLKSKQGSYQWYKLEIRCFHQNEENCEMIRLILEPLSSERILQLEYIRLQEFYKVLLSEMIAYVEVDLESGRLNTAGGLWESYEHKYDKNKENFIQVLERYLKNYVQPDELALFQRYRKPEEWKSLLQNGDHIQRFIYQRMIGQEQHWVEMVIHVFRENFTGNINALICLKDIDVIKKRELAQTEAANRDPLTNVYNRKAFEQEVVSYMQRTDKEVCGAIILLDIDNFKKINDQLGHLVGDEALIQMADVLLSTFRRKDIVGRLGGDEFLVFVKGVEQKEILDRYMKEFYDLLSKRGRDMITCSAGIVLISGKDFSYRKGIKEADSALYQSKRKGKNCYSYAQNIV